MKSSKERKTSDASDAQGSDREVSRKNVIKSVSDFYDDHGQISMIQSKFHEVMENVNELINNDELALHLARDPVAFLLCVHALSLMSFVQKDISKVMNELLVRLWPLIEQNSDINKYAESVIQKCFQPKQTLIRLLDLIIPVEKCKNKGKTLMRHNEIVWRFGEKMIFMIGYCQIGRRLLTEIGCFEKIEYFMEIANLNDMKLQIAIASGLKKTKTLLKTCTELCKNLQYYILRDAVTDYEMRSRFSSPLNSCFFTSIMKCLLNLERFGSTCHNMYLMRNTEKMKFLSSVVVAISEIFTTKPDVKINTASVIRLTQNYKLDEEDDTSKIFLRKPYKSFTFFSQLIHLNEKFLELFKFKVSFWENGTKVATGTIVDVKTVDYHLTEFVNSLDELIWMDCPQIIVCRVENGRIGTKELEIRDKDDKLHIYSLKSATIVKVTSTGLHCTCLIKEEDKWRYENDEATSYVELDATTDAKLLFYHKESVVEIED